MASSLPSAPPYPRGGRFAPEGWPVCSGMPADLLWNTQLFWLLPPLSLVWGAYWLFILGIPFWCHLLKISSSLYLKFTNKANPMNTTAGNSGSVGAVLLTVTFISWQSNCSILYLLCLGSKGPFSYIWILVTPFEVLTFVVRYFCRPSNRANSLRSFLSDILISHWIYWNLSLIFSLKVVNNSPRHWEGALPHQVQFQTHTSLKG